MANSVWLKGNGLVKEGKASSLAIRPGHLITWDTNDSTVKPCNKNPANPGLTYTRKAFALESASLGRGVPAIATDTSQNYVVGDQVVYVVPERGAEIQAWLQTGDTVAIGDALVSNGTGALKKALTSMGNDDEEIVGYSMQALSNSQGFDVRLRIEVA
jgi:hypothetical protein